MSELKRYSEAMVRGDLATCIAIEQKHELYGYPPEIVSVGLEAHDEGRDVLLAVDRYLDGDEE
ncbi:hypothetical protein [Pseudomonas typographi]|uniref:hypothetical protein n=1 Tax=Pseudomonas typographi TaxID=2715964 RepID=UPI00168921C3|nr:hypothetical protein [Pseudomonas typographi]MBD1554669.1 hypothetical protein [Pseudomonas typographi]